jgi:transcriptional regulator with XRE-family HTH domain
MDYARLASELMRAARGSSSQPAFSRWLGFRSNVAYAWESGRAYPTAAELLAVFERRGVSLPVLFERFHGRKPRWLKAAAPAASETIAAFLDELRGRQSLSRMAAAAGVSRYALARWLRAESEPRAPDFLRLVDVASHRVLDFVALLTDPAALPSAAEAWRKLEASRRAAYELPLSQVVLRALELSDYRALPRHVPGWISERLGISSELEQESLRLLEQGGHVRMHAGRYEPLDTDVVDLRRDPERAWLSRSAWTDLARERLAARSPGNYAYNVFGVSARDLERIRELQARHFRELRDLIARSQPVERVVLMIQHLIPLDRSASDEPPAS